MINVLTLVKTLMWDNIQQPLPTIQVIKDWINFFKFLHIRHYL